MNESGVHMKYGVMSLIIFFLIGFVFVCFMQPWELIREDAHKDSKMIYCRDTETIQENMQDIDQDIENSNVLTDNSE